MKKLFLRGALAALALAGASLINARAADLAPSPTEGVITHEFVSESVMKDDLLQMLADFSQWMKADFQECTSPNSVGEACGCFKGENTMANDEKGVRPNADLSMICAFLVKYGQGKVTLPEGVTWDDLRDLARKSLVFAYSTHKANKLKVCSGNNYWGSVSGSDHVWESSLWAMSVAYSAFFQWEDLTQAQRDYIRALLVAECNYELNRTIPTGYVGDTKAEENGWEADILAATLGMFPDDPLASKWYERLREFAVNSYSHPSDADNNTVADPHYNQTTVKQLYKGQNLYDDYTLQNHNLFHSSYQNVVMQELGEAALALKLFQTGLHGTETWSTSTLMHNNAKVQEEVLNWLALSDGELAMPNGNDWSLFLFDQITSYSTMACFLNDPDALMLENMAYKYIKARQSTTGDGSWLLRADVGARRMGVEAHRVMMTWLMHEVLPTASVEPTKWDEFRAAHSEARMFPSQNVVRAMTDSRFTCFSWSTGLKSYTGYIASTNPDNNKIIVPFRRNNTGNFLGWYLVDGKNPDATPTLSGNYDLKGDGWTMNGRLNTNGGTLNNSFAIYSTPGNAVIYVDLINANSNATILGEYGGLMAISTDPFTRSSRLLTSSEGSFTSDGSTRKPINSSWVNIDGELGFVTPGHSSMLFGDRENNNSIMTSRLYTLYDKTQRPVTAGQTVDRRAVVYYTSVDADKTSALAADVQPLKDQLPDGWNGVLVPDPDGKYYILLSNFASSEPASLSGLTTSKGAPVFNVPATIADSKASAQFVAQTDNSYSCPAHAFVKGNNFTVVADSDNPDAVYLRNETAADNEATVNYASGESKTFTVGAGKTVLATLGEGGITVSDSEMPENPGDELTTGYTDVTASFLTNPGFESDATYGTLGSVTLGSVTYDPCYINTVAPISTSFPNILPVKGWTPANTLEGESNYCRMYSMPYSTNIYCVSPSNVGNYTAICAPLIGSDSGDRCLTVLNSWSKGKNAIEQSATLPAGEYRVLINVKYECPNQTGNDGSKITTSGGNVNTSFTGVKVGGEERFAYPSETGRWETLVYDFSFDQPTTVGISLGYSSSASSGAANNTLLYIDNVRLLSKGDSGLTVVDPEVFVDGSEAVYDLRGVMVRPAGDTTPLAPGFYVAGTRKIAVR